MKKYLVLSALCAVSAACFVLGLTACAPETPEEKRLSYHEAVEASCTDGGNIEYWLDADSGKYYSDANGENEISPDSISTAPLGHVYGDWYYDESDYLHHYRYCPRCYDLVTELHDMDENNRCATCDYVYDYAEKGVTEGLGYTAIEENGEITGYKVSVGTVTGGNVVAPCWYLGKLVTEVAEQGFYGANITGFSFTDNIQTVGKEAFAGSSLNGYLYLSSVKNVGESAFANTSIQNLNTGVKLEIISASAFAGCTSLKNVTLSETVTYVGRLAFSGCTSLETLVIGAKRVVIDGNGESSAFYGCNIPTVYYNGTAEEWNAVAGKDALGDATVYYYSAEQPTESGNYWYYDASHTVTVW